MNRGQLTFTLKLLSCLIISLLLVAWQLPVYALTQDDINAIRSNTPFYDPNAKATCQAAVGGSPTLDYAGNPILTDAQSQAITANQTVYQEAAGIANIPWQMLAVIHLQETKLARTNPGNGQGIYQFFDKHGGPYPTGPVDDGEFLRQSILAAQFLSGKAGSNYPENRTLTATGSTPEAIKDTFYSYNGRAYAQQATSIGFDGSTQGYEGSPYVMTKADARRDPAVSPTTWGQVKRDNGPIEYPANDTYGAFVVYGALAGIKASCSAGTGTTSGTGLAWPEAHSVSITSCFGPRTDPVSGAPSYHAGIDISGGSGTPILAADDGTVTFAGPVSGYGNNYVAIQHASGYSTGYGHMSSKSVKVGDTVTKGQEIGIEGNEGHSTGFHLHFNVIPGEYKGSDASNIDPLQNGLTIPAGVTNPNDCS